MSVFVWLAARGRWMLVAGLIAGLAAPGLAHAMAPAIVPLIGVLLLCAALREGPRAAFPGATALPRTLALALALQLSLPLTVGAGLWAAGWLGHPLAAATLLTLAAAPITGAPGLAIMSGGDGRAALRHLTLATALLPLTAAPVFALLPAFPGPLDIALAAGRLLALVAAVGVLAGGLRARLPWLATPAARPALDTAIALAMALVVVALMAEIGPALRTAPATLAAPLALAGALYLGQSLGAWALSRRALPAPQAISAAIVAGNRNLALFLVALPPAEAAEVMVFVGCYQIPMYLTPFFVAGLRRLASGRACR